METLINLKPSELNNNIIETLKRMAQENGVTNITILLNNGVKRRKEKKKDYKTKLDAAIHNIERGQNLVSFSWEEFETLSNSLLKK
ncbi:MAG TPA: hypothetical protein VE978_09840 [Chitinophagales bacterium]|nr:hypothetical protein [Chitinophagales bacterium]